MSWWESSTGWEWGSWSDWSPSDWWRDRWSDWSLGDWWRDPDRQGDPEEHAAETGSGSQASGWWRDPEEHAAEIADDYLTESRRQAASEHGGPALRGAYFGGTRTGHHVDNYLRYGRQPGRSGSQHETHPTHHVFKISVPVNLKEAGYWWTETKQRAQEEDNMKVSYRAVRHSRQGPGWYNLTAAGPGGDLFLEWALRKLLRWRPDFDIEAVSLPKLLDDLPTQARSGSSVQA